MYQRSQCRSLRWNEHYRDALQSIARELYDLLPSNKPLKPLDIGDVAAAESIVKNLDKNAGYYGFVTGKRSKGENLDDAIKWCNHNVDAIKRRGYYGTPLVISHRSSNSKPKGLTGWKWKCRIILMQDVRALLLDGRFALPFTNMFKRVPWGEGSMTHTQVESWIQIQRMHYSRFYSSDYSSFDVSQPAWLLEDVFNVIMRPLFGNLSEDDELLFRAMCYSYIHKEIHSFDGIYNVSGCQLSGSLLTYCFNTIVNEVIDRTVLMMQGCNINNFVSLKCGDDNLTYYNSNEPWNMETHCKLIERYFGIKTVIDPNDHGCGTSDVDPSFLSRVWTFGGAERPLEEVVWNLLYPERYRDYSYEATHVTVERAVALVLLCACLEQPRTMRKYFKVDLIFYDAQVKRNDFALESTYEVLASLGSGFRTSWLNFKIPLLKQKVVS